MNTRVRTGRTILAATAGIVTLAIGFMWMQVESSRHVPSTTSDSLSTGHKLYAPLLQGYPAPVPTLTPVPLCDWFPAPPGLPTQVTTLQGSSDAALLVALQSELDIDDGTAISGRSNGSLAFRYSEECSGLLSAAQAKSALGQLFAAGSCPRIQGYMRRQSGVGNRTVFVFVTGWTGQVVNPFATANPDEPACGYIPVGGTYGWGLDYDASANTWSWREWQTGLYPYLVQSLWKQAYGTYYVIRP